MATEYVPLTSFAIQNWLVTPAALAVNEARPTSIHDQKWLLVLSGVAMVNFQGNSTEQWRPKKVRVRPDINDPLNDTIERYRIPRPPTSAQLEFQVDQWAPSVALGSIYNKHESIDSGFAVDIWRAAPFSSGKNALSHTTINGLFYGIDVDIAVRDTDAFLYRVSYNITLLGKLVFCEPIVIQ